MSHSNSQQSPEFIDELAAIQALYAVELGASSPPEEAEFDRIAEQERGEFANAVAAIAYAAPLLTPAADLKDRLFQRISVPIASDPGLTAASSPIDLESPVFSCRTVDQVWVPHDSVAGIMVSLLHLDEAQQIATCLMKVDPGVEYPLHRHLQAEEIFMLSGDLVLGDQIFNAGDYLRFGAGFSHAPGTQTGCTILIKSPIHEERVSVQPQPT